MFKTTNTKFSKFQNTNNELVETKQLKSKKKSENNDILTKPYFNINKKIFFNILWDGVNNNCDIDYMLGNQLFNKGLYLIQGTITLCMQAPDCCSTQLQNTTYTFKLSNQNTHLTILDNNTTIKNYPYKKKGCLYLIDIEPYTIEVNENLTPIYFNRIFNLNYSTCKNWFEKFHFNVLKLNDNFH